MLTCDPKASTMSLGRLCRVSGRRTLRRPLSMADAHTLYRIPFLFERAWHSRSSKTAVERPQARLRSLCTGEQRPGCEWGGRIMQATPRPRRLGFQGSSGRSRPDLVSHNTTQTLSRSSHSPTAIIRATKYSKVNGKSSGLTRIVWVLGSRLIEQVYCGADLDRD